MAAATGTATITTAIMDNGRGPHQGPPPEHGMATGMVMAARTGGIERRIGTASAWAIGIGAGLAARPLPHNRA